MVSININSWLISQVILFIFHYGFKGLPFWILWFPTLIVIRGNKNG